MLVVFGLFDEDPSRGPAVGAAAAVRCALGMGERLDQLNGERAALGHDPLAIKIGVHSGPLIAGTFGAADRHEYTVIGDTVNVAARLEELCHEHGCQLIVSKTAWRLAEAGGLALPPATPAAARPRGRGEPVDLYCVG
jgi:adenylate cyclase